ncbi:MAG: hypothetical protein LAT51_08105 [Flavobacteriaceae bacterium]|nr:hypothetical protein [Flavobacteriaceae bacterium]
MNRGLVFLLICFLVSCQDKIRESTIITGQIKNPNQDFLILTDRENFTDTIFLNSDGEFSYELQLLEEKVFHFKHAPEIQLIYIQPNDSLTLHLNTVDFDGSLAFGGDSAKENNLLINLFLDFRKDKDLLFNHHKYNFEEFLSLSDSIKNAYLTRVNADEEQLKNRSEFFKDYVQNSIQYHSYNLNESFVFLMKREEDLLATSDLELIDSYRKNVKINKSDSFWDLAYLKFLDNYTKNLAVEECIERGIESPLCHRLNTVEHLISRRNVVSDLIENPYLKNHLIKRFLTLEITYADTHDKIQNTLDAIEDYNLLKSDIDFLNRLALFHEQFVVGNTVSNVDFVDVNGNLMTLEPLLTKPTIVHTWSAFSDSNVQRRLPKINRLREIYPDIDIVGLNIDYNQHRFWRSKVLEHQFDTNLELQVQPNPEFEDLYIYYINKLFFVCPHGKVRDRKLLIFDDQIESSILELINNNHKYM